MDGMMGKVGYEVWKVVLMEEDGRMAGFDLGEALPVVYGLG